MFIYLKSVYDGEYWRLLTPGQYEVMAVKAGYEPQIFRVNVDNKDTFNALRLDFKLKPFADNF